MDYDFIEIGTSDFDTLIESASDMDIGLSIEPVALYLNRLADKKNVRKVNCAVGDTNGRVKVYYVSPDDVVRFNLPPWVRGCNSVIGPHPSTYRVLERHGLLHLMQTIEVDCCNWATLVRRYDIDSVKLLKIDAEGHDCYIVNGILDSGVSVFPKRISFENNVLTDKELLSRTLEKLASAGYQKVGEVGEDFIFDL